jgi:hypothetical protein
MYINQFKDKWPEVVTPDGIISLSWVAQFIHELPYLIRDGIYDQSVLDEFKHDFNMLNVQQRRDESLTKLGIC